MDWGWTCAVKIVATTKCKLNCINDLNNLRRKAVRPKMPNAATLLNSDLWKLLWVHFVTQQGNQLEGIACKEVTPGKKHIVDLTVGAKSRYSAEVEGAEDKTWDVKPAEQLEGVRISTGRLDAAVDRKLILARQKQQDAAVHGHKPEGNDADLWMEVVKEDLKG